MKKIISISAFLFLIISLSTVNAAQVEKSSKTSVNHSSKVEIYYFHYTRRCATCEAVETETLKAIAALYPTQYKAGKISFKSVNLDEKKSKVLAEKCKAEGQQLLIISGKKRIDLTDSGFMYARSNPEKLKLQLKNTIDPLIN